jgi:leucyl-tRNA synthetase
VDTVQIVVQVNGKLRARLELAAGLDEEEVKSAALAEDNVQRFIGDQSVRKVIYVPGKLVNVVV